MKKITESRYACTSQRYGDCEDRPRRVKAQIFSILTIVGGASYLWWIFNSRNPDYPMVSSFFVFAEFACLGLFVMATLGLWRLRFKPLSGIEGERARSVDVFITTYNEPLRVLWKTFQGTTRIQWDGDLRVHVLDDGGRSDVKALSRKFGFNYLSRGDAGLANENAKSGNLNFGLSQTSGDLVLVLDADQVPAPNIVISLAGYMRFEKVAFVQSKQSYLTQAGDPFYNKSQVFYDVVQLALDNNDNAMSAGSGVLYRRKALEDIGGFVTWNMVEDFTTSYELHAKGWKSFYVPHALSKGLAPTGIWEVYQQRGQWALDTMRLFLWDNPLFKKGLRWMTRVGYLTVALSYLSAAFVFPFFFLLPIWSYITGNAILTHPETEFVLVRGAYFLLMVLALHYLCYKQQPGKQFRMLAGLFPIYMAGFLRAFKYPKGKKPGYCQNNAATTCLASFKTKPPIIAVLPQAIILVLNLVMPFVSLFMGWADPRLVAGNAFISALAIWSMSKIVISAIAPGTWEPEEEPDYVYSYNTPQG